MAIFIGVHSLPGVNHQDVPDGWKRYKVAALNRGIKAITAYYSDIHKKGYCLTEANSENDVERAHRDINMAPEEILAVNKL